MLLQYNPKNGLKTISLLMLNFLFITVINFAYADSPTKTINIKPNAIHKVGQDKKNSKVKMIESEIKQTLVSIKKIIGSAKCSDNTSCAAIAIGQKACGGPQNFLPYSTQNTDVTRLTALSRKHQNLNRQLNKLAKRMSDCMLLSAPVVSCQNQKCQKR